MIARVKEAESNGEDTVVCAWTEPVQTFWQRESSGAGSVDCSKCEGIGNQQYNVLSGFPVATISCKTHYIDWRALLGLMVDSKQSDLVYRWIVGEMSICAMNYAV